MTKRRQRRIATAAYIASMACGAAALVLAACSPTDVNPPSGKNEDRIQALRLADVKPERFVPGDIEQRSDSVALRLPVHRFDTDEDGQMDSLPPLPFGMTMTMITDGDRIFHGRGGCVNCHGLEAEGLAARGKTLTAGLRFIPVGDWNAIDSVISVGMPDAVTRTPIAMPPRGQFENLTADEMRRTAAYVWAISQVKGEPWPGGHPFHGPHDWRASARTSIP
jgi:cytochrome c5